MEEDEASRNGQATSSAGDRSLGGGGQRSYAEIRPKTSWSQARRGLWAWWGLVGTGLGRE